MTESTLKHHLDLTKGLMVISLALSVHCFPGSTLDLIFVLKPFMCPFVFTTVAVWPLWQIIC